MNSQILLVDGSLASTFQQAQETNSIRCIHVNVVNESLISAKATPISSQENPELEWQAIQLECSTPSLLLFHFASTNGPWKWILVANVSDDLPAREKMLYASARDCLKQQLGIAYFAGDVHTTDVKKFTYSELISATHNISGPLSAREVLLKEEASLERDLSVKSSAMNVMPFVLSDDLKNALVDFSQQSGSHWLSLSIENEQLKLGSSIQNIKEDKVNDVVDKINPSYVLYRYDGQLVEYPTVFLLYICPEDANVRLKMTYSTAKASLLNHLQESGIKTDKLIEIADPSNVMEAIRSDVSFAVADEAARPKTFSRPLAPGRGRGRGRRN